MDEQAVQSKEGVVGKDQRRLEAKDCFVQTRSLLGAEFFRFFVRSTSRHLSQSRKRQVTTLARGCLQSPVAACVSFGLSRETRRPAATLLHSVVHSRTWWRPRRAFHVPLGVLPSKLLLSQTLAFVSAADCTAPPTLPQLWYHPRRNHFSQGAHHADPGQHNGSVQGAQHAVPVWRHLQRE